MIVGNNKPICVIGYEESSMTQEFVNEIAKTHKSVVTVPSKFLNNISRDYQYIISVSVDLEERKKIIKIVDEHDLDLVTVIHDTVIIGNHPPAVIMPGTFIFPFCNISIASSIGRHCIVGAYTLIGHYSSIGHNCIIRPGVTVTGKSELGNNCIVNTKSTITNKSIINDCVEIMAFAKIIKNIGQPGSYAGRSKKIN